MRVVIVDDDRIVSHSIQLILQASGHEVVGIGENGLDAIALYKEHQPDILLSDIRMAECNGLDASKEILQYYPNANILLLTTFVDDAYIQEALQIGVKGYILKQNFESLPSAIEAILQNNAIYDTSVLSKVQTSPSKKHPLLKELNEKDLTIIALVATGLNNKEIAEQLYLSEGSVRNHISLILSKLQLRDRTQLAIFYYEYIK